MSTKKKTTSTFNRKAEQKTTFDPGALAEYRKLTPLISQVLQDYMKDPRQATFFNQMIQMSNQQAGRTGQAMNRNLFQNQLAGGFSGNNMGAMQQSMLAANQRAVSGQKQGGFTNALLFAEQARRGATAQAQAFRPLQTGGTQTASGTSTSVSRTSGLGTWLPQVAGAAIAGVAGALGGQNASSGMAASLGGGGGFSGSQALGALPFQQNIWQPQANNPLFGNPYPGFGGG